MRNATSGILTLPTEWLEEPAPSLGEGPERLGLGGGRDGLLARSSAAGPRPLWIAFHGAGGDGQQMVRALTPHALAAGAHLLAIDSRRSSWDLLAEDGFGPDVAFLQSALERTCARAWVDPAAIVAVGYSDGASYALSLALRNPSLFSNVIAYAPGFVLPPASAGPLPCAYVTHGHADEVLPFDRCGRRVAVQLARWGVDAFFEAHGGGHALTPEVVAGAFRWLAEQDEPTRDVG